MNATKTDVHRGGIAGLFGIIIPVAALVVLYFIHLAFPLASFPVIILSLCCLLALTAFVSTMCPAKALVPVSLIGVVCTMVYVWGVYVF
jgi:hypothetical protein